MEDFLSDHTKRAGASQNAFSSNLNTLNLNNFTSHCEIFTWRQSTDYSIELIKDSSLRLITKRLTLFRMGFFGAAHGLGAQKSPPPPLHKICYTYPTMMKLGTVILYPKRIQKLYESHDTLLEFCWHLHFFTGNQQILLYQGVQI